VCFFQKDNLWKNINKKRSEFGGKKDIRQDLKMWCASSKKITLGEKK